MVYLFGLIGFVTGFAIGLGIINVLLRKQSLDEIKSKPSNKWKFGTIVWVLGILGAWVGANLYHGFF